MKTLFILLIFISVLMSCTNGKKVENTVEESTAKLVLIATTPEGVKIYYLDPRNGDYACYLAVGKDGNVVSITKH